MITLSYKIDREHGPKRIYELTKLEFPGKTEEFYQLISQERWRYCVRYALRDFMSDKLGKTGFYSSDAAEDEANDIMKDLPEELFPNIEEWLNDKPLSEIKYGKISIKKLVELDRSHNFLRSVKKMLFYIKRGCQGEEFFYSSLIHD